MYTENQKQMNDEIVIAEALGGQVRIHAARTTAMVSKAQQIHNCAPTSAAALGRTMTVAALMASDLKNPGEHVQVRIDGKGPCGAINVQADGAGNVRGMIANPGVHMVRNDGHLAVGEAVGTNGSLTVSRDMGLKEPFTGIVPLQTGEIGDDFAYYYVVSEQIPSAVAVGVLIDTDLSVKAAGGLIFQLLPNADEEVISAVEKTVREMKHVSEYMQEEKDVEEIIHQLFADAVILSHKPVRWHCDCSREHFADALATLHDKDLNAMIQEDHGAEIICDYCHKVYQFTQADLQQILEDKHRA